MSEPELPILPDDRPTIGQDLAAGTAFPFADRTYRRRIVLQPAPGMIHAEMEDYVHHFELQLEHRDGTIIAAFAEGVRHPWDTCPGGARGVAKLVGTPLAAAGDVRGWFEDRTAQCVHVVDLAVLAAAHALDDQPTELEIVIPGASRRERTAVLRRDGSVVLEWSLKGDVVVAPERFAGLRLTGAAFFPWLHEHAVVDDELEAATILRRACIIGFSRGMDLDRYAVAADGGAVNDSCFVFRPEVAIRSRRMVGTTRATELD